MHLKPAQLEPDATLDAAAVDHLAACARCRLEARWVAEFHTDDGSGLAELDDVLLDLDTVRAGLTLSFAAGAAPPGPSGIADPGDRYTMDGALGAGGMADVYRVTDRALSRSVAMKIARLQGAPRDLARFIDEAKVAAQLQHPGVVPVHDLGQLPDGRTYFTMQEIEGLTLREAIADVHRGSRADDGTGKWGRWATGPQGWTLRRLLDALRRVSETVAYAHSRGVIHRDLKPSNIMLGPWGEVLVLDWGLAKVQDGPERPVAVGRTAEPALATQAGLVAGTAAYMAPEQARGAPAGPASDVYALGGILSMVLTNRLRVGGADLDAMLKQVRAGALRPLTQTAGPLPPELAELIEACLQARADDRPTAAEVARALGDWLDGASRRERALAILDDARALEPLAASKRLQADRLRAQARIKLRALASHAPPADKEPAWALEGRAAELDVQADLDEVRFTQAVSAAFSHAPDLPEARQLLAAHYHQRHLLAERDGSGDAARLEALLRSYDDGQHAEYLDGKGTLTVCTEPSGASVRLVRLTERGRRLVPAAFLDLGKTPLLDQRLELGSVLVRIEHPTTDPVTLPLRVPRAGSAEPRDTQTGRPRVHRLPLAGALAQDDVLVPAGTFVMGGDPLAQGSLSRRTLWVDAFVIKRHPVTHAQYLGFLDDLERQGRTDEALRHAPRERGTTPGVPGALLVTHTPGAGFALRTDAEGDTWDPDWPAWMIDWHGARAYAAWAATRDGVAWRLPYEAEWEKAARGVDGRAFPWGPDGDPSLTVVHGSQPGRAGPEPVGSRATDASPLGVLGMGGNVCDWVLDVYGTDGPTTADGVFTPAPVDAGSDLRRCVKGGSWSNPLAHARCAFRDGRHPGDRRWVIGFRLARAW